MVRTGFRAPALAAGLLLLLMIVVTIPAYAGSAVGVALTPACTGYTVQGGSITANRDNTGRGREAIVITARDGVGQILYDSQTSYPINQGIAFSASASVSWTRLPAANPILLEILSPGGNGQPDQLIYAVTGTCASLPTFGSAVSAFSDDLTLLPFAAPADGSVSVPYDPNSPPPRPVNPLGLAKSQSGYAIVSTDNLFLRSGDGAEYSPLGVLDGGTRLVLLGSNGKTGDDLWWYVQVGGLRGWVKSTFLYLRGKLASVPIVPVQGSLTQPTLYVGVANPIYTSASAGSRYLCQITGDHLYTVVARNAEAATWYRIEASCDGQALLGWIQANRGLLRNPGGINIPLN